MRLTLFTIRNTSCFEAYNPYKLKNKYWVLDFKINDKILRIARLFLIKNQEGDNNLYVMV